MNTSETFSFLSVCRSRLLMPLATGTALMMVLAPMAEAQHHHKHEHSAHPARHPAHKSEHSASHLKKTPVQKPSASSAHHSHAHHTGKIVAAAGATAAVAGAHAPVAPDAPPAPVDSAQAPVPETDKGSNTGLPLPRFAALRADKVYMRRGPGDRYPIDWVYHRRGLPVQIDREFDVWRLVEDSDGQKGWVHQATLYGSRTFVIPGLPPEGVKAQAGEESEKAGDHIGRADARVLGHLATQDEARARKSDVLLMSHPEEDSSVVAVLQSGTVGNIKACPQSSQWCHVVVKGYDGWLPRRLFWGLLPNETIQSN